MNDKVIFIHLAVHTGSSQFFHAYLPWRDGPYVDAVKYATASEIEEQQTYVIDRIFSDNAVNDVSNFSPNCIFKYECDIVLPLVDIRLFYYDFERLNYNGFWLKADDYVKFLDKSITRMCHRQHPYVIQLERLRDDIKCHIKQIQNIGFDAKQLKFDFAPALSIPKTRFDEFATQRHTQQARQRFGQAFFNYMGAHKCTQDKAWWDRLYQADDDEARSMIKAVIDWDN